MSDYRFTSFGVERLVDGAFIPSDPANRHWLVYLGWVDAGGKTLPLEAPTNTTEEERRWRDAEIESVRWLRERHRDEVDSDRPTSMTKEQSGELLDYVQALRDWPKSPKFPAQKSRPKKPGWITGQNL